MKAEYGLNMASEYSFHVLSVLANLWRFTIDTLPSTLATHGLVF